MKRPVATMILGEDGVYEMVMLSYESCLTKKELKWIALREREARAERISQRIGWGLSALALLSFAAGRRE